MTSLSSSASKSFPIILSEAFGAIVISLLPFAPIFMIVKESPARVTGRVKITPAVPTFWTIPESVLAKVLFVVTSTPLASPREKELSAEFVEATDWKNASLARSERLLKFRLLGIKSNKKSRHLNNIDGKRAFCAMFLYS